MDDDDIIAIESDENSPSNSKLSDIPKQKNQWSLQEDIQLLALVKKYGKSDWELIYNKMPDWPRKQIQDRYLSLNQDKKTPKAPKVPKVQNEDLQHKSKIEKELKDYEQLKQKLLSEVKLVEQQSLLKKLQMKTMETEDPVVQQNDSDATNEVVMKILKKQKNQLNEQFRELKKTLNGKLEAASERAEKQFDLLNKKIKLREIENQQLKEQIDQYTESIHQANQEYEKLEFENKKQKKMIEKMKEIIQTVIADENNVQNDNNQKEDQSNFQIDDNEKDQN